MAAALDWHLHHASARAAFTFGETRALAHAATETYSVLTRLPGPDRVPADVAWEFLAAAWTWPALVLPAAGYREVLRDLSRHGLGGGAVYDALIAATAQSAGATLVSLDRRAARIYGLMKVDYRLIP